MRFSRVLVVDCGTTRVLGGLFTSDAAGRLTLERFGVERLPRRERTEEAWLAETGAALLALARRASLTGSCVLGLPGHLTFSRVVKLPPVSARQRRKIIRFEARQGIPAALAGVVWTHASPASRGNGPEEVLTAVQRSVIEALGARLRAAGLYPRAALPPWFVLRQGTVCHHPDSTRALAVAIGARSTHLVAGDAAGGCIRTLALGGDTITEKIAGELGLDFSRAEALKLQVLGGESAAPDDAPERIAVRMAADEFIRRLGGEIGRSLVRSSPENGGDRPAFICLSGGGAQISDLPARLTESLHLPVVRRDPWRQPGAGEMEKIAPAMLSDLADLAAAAVGRPAAAVSLWPGALRREMFFRRRWPWLAAAASLLALATAGAILREQALAVAARRRMVAVENGIAELRGFDRRNRRNRERLAETNRRLAALQRVVEAKRSWTGFLADLQERLAQTGDAWLEKLEVMPPAPGPKYARSAERGAPPSHVRVNLAGCLFDPENPLTHVGEGAYRRARTLLAQFRESPYVAAVENERFDGGQPGMLRFELTLVLAPGKVL